MDSGLDDFNKLIEVLNMVIHYTAYMDSGLDVFNKLMEAANNLLQATAPHHLYRVETFAILSVA